MKTTVPLLPLLLSLFAVPGAAADGAGPYSFTLKGKAFDERCLKLAAGQSIRYSFRSTEPVDFNIHYHHGKDVLYPVRQAGVREANATFRAEAADDYCLMWEHKGAGVANVDGSLELASAR